VVWNCASYRFAKGAFLVYSITDRATFERVPFWAASVKGQVPSAVLVLVGTKADRAKERQVSFCEGAQLALSLEVPFLETSAKQATNVDQAFFVITKLIGTKLGMDFSHEINFE